MDSNSSSDQTQLQEQQDNRIAAAKDSVNLVASRSSIKGNVTINSTDHDAVGKSFEFARQISKDAADENAASMQGMKSLSVSAMSAVQDAYQNADEKLAAAYSEAKAGEQKVMVAVGVAAVTVVALSALKKG